MFWHYYQSAPGWTKLIENDDLARHVIIEADNAEEANNRAETEAGMIFNVRECPCCDTRWDDFLEDGSDDDMGTETPCVYDYPIHECTDRYLANDSVIIYYKDGRKEKTKVKMKGDK